MSGSSTDTPRLSVVVVAFNGPALLTRCLDALSVRARMDNVEILVVSDRRRPDTRPTSAIQEARPEVRWVEAPAGSTIPRLKSLGIEVSRGDIVAIIEDDCLVDPGWQESVLAAHRTPDVAIGGAVEPGPYRRSLDWAVYFCEYGRFMLPFGSASNAALAGNNVSYKRGALADLPAGNAGGFYDVFVHRAWQRKGLPTRIDPTVIVRNMNSWRAAHVTVVPYHHGRAFAGHRWIDRPMALRLAIAVPMLFLPALKVGRVIGATVARRRLILRLIPSLPFVLAFAVSWSAGEVAGCLFGPGDSLSRWR